MVLRVAGSFHYLRRNCPPSVSRAILALGPNPAITRRSFMSTANPQPLARDDGRLAAKRESMTLDATTITRRFMKYTRTFQSLDPRAALRHVHVPFVFVDGQEMRVLSSTAEVEALLATVMRNLASVGYARSDLEELWTYPLGANIALVSVARARYTAEGAEIDCLGETYTLLRDVDGEWRIGMAVVHDAANVLRARPRCRRGAEAL
jgi:hypothetical protein